MKTYLFTIVGAGIILSMFMLYGCSTMQHAECAPPPPCPPPPAPKVEEPSPAPAAEEGKCEVTAEAPPGPKEGPEPRREGTLGTFHDIHFGFDSCDLSNKSKDLLEKNWKLLKDYPQEVVTIEGFADKTEAPTIKYGLKLSVRRADVIKSYLVEQGGIDPSRLKTIGYGKSKPLYPGSDQVALARNRRVHFVIFNADFSSGSSDLDIEVTVKKPRALKTQPKIIKAAKTVTYGLIGLYVPSLCTYEEKAVNAIAYCVLKTNPMDNLTSIINKTCNRCTTFLRFEYKAKYIGLDLLQDGYDNLKIKPDFESKSPHPERKDISDGQPKKWQLNIKPNEFDNNQYAVQLKVSIAPEYNSTDAEWLPLGDSRRIELRAPWYGRYLGVIEIVEQHKVVAFLTSIFTLLTMIINIPPIKRSLKQRYPKWFE